MEVYHRLSEGSSHSLAADRLGVQQDGIPRDYTILKKSPLVVQVRTPEHETAIRFRIAYLGVNKFVEAGDRLPEQPGLANFERRRPGSEVRWKRDDDGLKHVT